MCDSRRNVDRQLSWVKVGFDGAEVPVLTGRTHKWRVGGWVGGLYGKLKEVRMDGKGTLKMFTRKKRELIKTPSISKKSRSGSPGPQTNACSVSSSSFVISSSVLVSQVAIWFMEIIDCRMGHSNLVKLVQ